MEGKFIYKKVVEATTNVAWHFTVNPSEVYKLHYANNWTKAQVGLGVNDKYNSAIIQKDLYEALPALKDTFVRHPVYKISQLLDEIIINLNDHHKWSREQIADWLDTLDVDLTF